MATCGAGGLCTRNLRFLGSSSSFCPDAPSRSGPRATPSFPTVRRRSGYNRHIPLTQGRCHTKASACRKEALAEGSGASQMVLEHTDRAQASTNPTQHHFRTTNTIEAPSDLSEIIASPLSGKDDSKIKHLGLLTGPRTPARLDVNRQGPWDWKYESLLAL